MYDDDKIIRFERDTMKILHSILDANQKDIIKNLFEQYAQATVFPGVSYSDEELAEFLWEGYFKDNDKLSKYMISKRANCFVLEKRKFIAKVWIRTVNDNLPSYMETNLFEVSKNISSYKKSSIYQVGGKKWKPIINEYENNKVVITYVIEFIKAQDNFYRAVRLMCLPNGQLSKKYRGKYIISDVACAKPDSVYFDLSRIVERDSGKSWRYKITYFRKHTFSSLDEIEEIKKIESLEMKYLNKYYHFLKFSEDEMLEGFQTKEKIRRDWEKYYGSGISDFAVGAERIVYALLNGKGIGQPNSAPVGADLFFEVSDAFIHIDLKTVNINNIGDYNTNIFVGRNQNSYNGCMIVEPEDNGIQKIRDYEPSLPYYYNGGTEEAKVCLSYFVTILYDSATLDIYLISLLCMPNGLIEKVYGSLVLQAGKNIDLTRYSFAKADYFISSKKNERVMCITRNDEKICSYSDSEHKTGLTNALKYYMDMPV